MCAPTWSPSESNLHTVTWILMLVKETTGLFRNSKAAIKKTSAPPKLGHGNICILIKASTDPLLLGDNVVVV